MPNIAYRCTHIITIESSILTANVYISAQDCRDCHNWNVKHGVPYGYAWIRPEIEFTR